MQFIHRIATCPLDKVSHSVNNPGQVLLASPIKENILLKRTNLYRVSRLEILVLLVYFSLICFFFVFFFYFNFCRLWLQDLQCLGCPWTAESWHCPGSSHGQKGGRHWRWWPRSYVRLCHWRDWGAYAPDCCLGTQPQQKARWEQAQWNDGMGATGFQDPSHCWVQVWGWSSHSPQSTHDCDLRPTRPWYNIGRDEEAALWESHQGIWNCFLPRVAPCYS